jgi:hypothetical protein
MIKIPITLVLAFPTKQQNTVNLILQNCYLMIIIIINIIIIFIITGTHPVSNKYKFIRKKLLFKKKHPIRRNFAIYLLSHISHTKISPEFELSPKAITTRVALCATFDYTQVPYFRGLCKPLIFWQLWFTTSQRRHILSASNYHKLVPYSLLGVLQYSS